MQNLRATDLDRTTEQEWHDWTATCGCAWPAGGTENEYFPTSRHHEGISNTCELHHVVEACGDYLDLID